MGRLTILAVVVMLVWSHAAWAQRGVAVDVGRIDVEEMLHPGESYTLPSIEVRNPGNRPSRYVFSVSSVENDRLTVPEHWVRTTPASLRLGPGEREQVQVVLTISDGAAPGRYETLLAARLVDDREGMRIGAAAATRLSFVVADDPSPPAEGVRRSGWWLGLLLGVGSVFVLRRRFRGVRIRIERQR